MEGISTGDRHCADRICRTSLPGFGESDQLDQGLIAMQKALAAQLSRAYAFTACWDSRVRSGLVSG